MQIDLVALKAQIYDKVRLIQQTQSEIKALDAVIAEHDVLQSQPAGDASQPAANDDAAKDEQGAETQADAPDEK